MPYNAQDVIYPQNWISHVVEVLHEDPPGNEDGFSIALLELRDGSQVYGLRHNYNYWNEDNPDIGYPTVRPGNPTWFILPNITDLLNVMNRIFNRGIEE